jgi:L,D-peptidoglycan transpeptidase YkuD (ErfK/YbiS/YcfS/YnhG family)
MRMSVYIPVFLTICASLFLASVCASVSDAPDKSSKGNAQLLQRSDFPGSHEKLIGESSQVLVVRNANPDVADVQVVALEKRNSRWESPFAPINGVIGKNGFAPPAEKREGDGRTPSGIFLLGTVFGYESSFPTKMPYRQATNEDIWVDDINADDYNRWVKRRATRASSFEKMRRSDNLYKYGIVVEYNMNPIVKGYGSAIFIHVWRGQGRPTEGCVGMSQEDIVKIIRWLDPASKPLVIMGTNITIGGY